jgi:hypothetical protein
VVSKLSTFYTCFFAFVVGFGQIFVFTAGSGWIGISGWGWFLAFLVFTVGSGWIGIFGWGWFSAFLVF